MTTNGRKTFCETIGFLINIKTISNAEHSFMARVFCAIPSLAYFIHLADCHGRDGRVGREHIKLSGLLTNLRPNLCRARARERRKGLNMRVSEIKTFLSSKKSLALRH
jgi:hypothetical protein